MHLANHRTVIDTDFAIQLKLSLHKVNAYKAIVAEYIQIKLQFYCHNLEALDAGLQLYLEQNYVVKMHSSSTFHITEYTSIQLPLV
jgi:hypothetical protein